jgi:sulfatase maturation enzyme AslB (radical SAM superfamily)
MVNFEYGNGLLVSIAKNETALKELSEENKNILYQSLSGYIIFPFEHKLENLDITTIELLDSLSNFDVIEMYGDSNFRVLFNSSSNDNALVVTNKCNSNCIMCPCSETYRKKDCNETIEHLCKIIEYIPTDTRFLTITGGEPTLINKDFYILCLDIYSCTSLIRFFN